MPFQASMLIFFLTLLSSPVHAFTALCEASGEEPPLYFGGAAHLAVFSEIDLDCVMPGKGKNQSISFTLQTYGPGLENFIYSGIVIECPLVSKKRLNRVLKKNGKWSVGGVGVSAGAILLGARAGVAVNGRGAFCTIAGLNLVNVVASAGYIQLTTEDESLYDQPSQTKELNP